MASGGVIESGACVQTTQDALFGGRMVLLQPARGTGYRTSVDSLLLAGFAAAGGERTAGPLAGAARGDRPRSRVAFDLGSGVGPVGLALLRFEAACRVVFVEIDPAAASLAGRNLEANGWAERGEVVSGDVLDVARRRRGEADLVVCNPPYAAPGRGRVRSSEAAGVRVGDLARFVAAARQVAGRHARVCFVYPAQELATLLARLADEGLHAKRARFVHARPNSTARIALVEAQPGRAGGLVVMPSVVEREQGAYSPEMQSLLAGR